MTQVERRVECIVIGGGQAGLACGYYLRRTGIDFVILDANPEPGGSWQHVWDSLTLFSPSNASNLPGWPMPHYDGFPPASHVVDYLTRYEQRYELPVERPVRVTSVTHDGEFFTVTADDPTGQRVWAAPTVVAATGTWEAPFVPHYPGAFAGKQWHTVNYPGPEAFRGSHVAVVGGANSGAQIAAELALDGDVDVQWFTSHPPRWMPDDVDGRVLFQRNRERLNAILRGEPDPGAESELGDIVMVPPVRRARDLGHLNAQPMFSRLDEVDADHLIWATGFRPALGPLRKLLVKQDKHGREVSYSPAVPALFLVGYGSWTGPGSATITGVSPFAREAAARTKVLLGR